MCVYTRVYTHVLKALQSCETLSLFTMDASLTHWLPPPEHHAPDGVLEADPRRRRQQGAPARTSDLPRCKQEGSRWRYAHRS